MIHISTAKVRVGIILSAILLVLGVAFGQELKGYGPPSPTQWRVEKVPDAVQAATIAAEGNQAAARINALQAKENAQLQADIAGRQFWTGVATAFAGLIAAGLTLKKIKEDSTNTKKQLTQAKEQYEKSQLTTAIESDRKRLEDRFVDAQNRLGKQGSDHEAVSAINRLVEIAQTLDPGIGHRPDEEALPLLSLPNGWSARLSSDSKQRPTEQAFPYFKPVALRLASIVLLEEGQAARDAAGRGIGRMAGFSIREIEDMTWADFEKLAPGRSPLPLTKFLAETFAQASRDAEKQWLSAWGAFTSGMRKLNKGLEFVNTAEWSIEQDAFPNWPTRKTDEDAAQYARRTRKVRKTYLFPQLIYDETGRDPEWVPDDGLWSTAYVMCSFIEGNGDLLTDYLLDAAEMDAAKRAATLQTNVEPSDQATLRREITQTLGLASQKAMSTRDALATILRSIKLDDSQLHPDFRDSGEYGWDGDRAAKTQVKITEFFPEPGMNRTMMFLDKFNLNLPGAWLVGADLRAADFSGIRLIEANLTGANLSLAKMNGTGFYSTSLWGALLGQVHGVGTHLFAANLNGADLTTAQLPAANAPVATFIEADLMMAQLPGADLNGAAFNGANICTAYFPNAKTGGMKLRDAIVSEAQIDGFGRPASEIEKECYVVKNADNSLQFPPGTDLRRKKAWPRNGENEDAF